MDERGKKGQFMIDGEGNRRTKGRMEDWKEGRKNGSIILAHKRQLTQNTTQSETESSHEQLHEKNNRATLTPKGRRVAASSPAGCNGRRLTVTHGATWVASRSDGWGRALIPGGYTHWKKSTCGMVNEELHSHSSGEEANVSSSWILSLDNNYIRKVHTEAISMGHWVILAVIYLFSTNSITTGYEIFRVDFFLIITLKQQQ